MGIAEFARGPERGQPGVAALGQSWVSDVKICVEMFTMRRQKFLVKLVSGE